MRAKAGIFIIICLLLLVGTVAAVDTSVISTSRDWVIANGTDQSTITVNVQNTNITGPVAGATVEFSVDSLYGTISPTTTITGSSGSAATTFTVKTKSGAANITATIRYNDGGLPVNATKILYQNIDHDSPYYADFTYPLSGTVASMVFFNASIRDQYGNPVDNRRGNHIISLHVHGPAPDDCGFAESSYAHDVTSTLDTNGNTSVNIKLTSTIGDNNIVMDAYQSIPSQLEWINAEARGKPYSITQVFSPSGSPPTLPADGTSFFTVIYNLYDQYGNPTKEQYIWINTSVSGEEKQFLSNNMGQVTVQYGPRFSIGDIDITATAIGNTTVTCHQWVKFKDTGAEIISLTANPASMASQDYNEVHNPSFASAILATVADHSGNPVPGETVTFTVSGITYEGTYNVTANPFLVVSSNITDDDGVAAVQFIPGSFTTAGNPGHNASATGHATIIATWNGTQKSVPVTWKNYPYLSVFTSVTPLNVEVNQTIDVTIGFRGDGWAMQTTPVDVILCTDRSGSMLYDDPDRMHSVREAGKVFIDQMNILKDYVGLVTFGRNGYISRPGVNSGISTSEIDNTYSYPVTYSDYATVDRPLSNGFPAVKTALNNIVPDHGTPMRSALYKSVNEIIANGHSGSVQAIILLSDGDYNWYGDPLARGTGRADGSGYHADNYGDLTSNYMTFTGLGSGQFSEQNMSVYAKNHGIKIYSIAFADSISSGGRTTLSVLANATGGKYYVASATDIEDVYKAIAQELKDTAGVNTTMVADFENINVTSVPMPGNQVFNYVYNPTASTKINWQNGTTTVINQSVEWATNNNKLSFNIGTIKVGQLWNATFRLRVNQSGLIDVFGNHSTVSFNGGTEILNLPQTFITVVPKLNVTDITTKTITLEDLRVTELGEIKVFLPVTWNSTYTGNQTLNEKVYYRIDNGPWVLFDTKTHMYDPSITEYTDFAQLDVTKLPPGGYLIKVYATASDAPDATIILGDPVNVGNRGRTYIKLQ